MKSEWKERLLGSLCSRLSSGKGISAAQLSLTAPIPVYGGNGIRGYVHEGNFSGECAIIGRQGAYCGNVRFFCGSAYMTEHAVIVQANEANDTRFLAYKLSLMDLGRLSGQSAQPGLSVKVLAQQSLRVPSRATQRKIAAVLSSLDNKIETNLAVCRNLEEQAEALYKRLMASGENNRNESDIYVIADIVYGAPFASSRFNTEGKGLSLIRIRDLKRQQSDTYTDEKHPKAYLIQPGDIVVGMDGEFQPYIWGGKEALLNQRVCVFQNKRPKGNFFLYFVLKPLLYRIEQTEMATTVIHIGKQDFDAFRFLMPSEVALSEYEERTHPMYKQIVSLNQENRRLAALRDTLLPRLMRGELDVSAVKL